jgi:hypothetical protein
MELIRNIDKKRSRKFSSYVRFCKRCDIMFRTDMKTATICSDCRIPNNGEQMRDFKAQMEA